MAQQRPLTHRVLGAIAGGFLSVVGVLLLLPLPEAGLPLLLIGLRLLAWQFEWAQKANEWLDAKAKEMFRHFKSQPLGVRIFSTLFSLAIAALVIWWLAGQLTR